MNAITQGLSIVSSILDFNQVSINKWGHRRLYKWVDNISESFGK